MLFKRISEGEFFSSNDQTLFYNQNTNRCFGVLEENNARFVLGWNSDLIEPSITYVKEGTYCVGIDQRIAIIDFLSREILLKKELPYFFSNSIVNGSYLYIISELEILKYDISTLSIVDTIELPEIFEEIHFLDDRTMIQCQGGVSIAINL